MFPRPIDSRDPGAIDYTGHLARLMADIIRRVPTLNFIDLTKVLVFARTGRTGADGAYASCHSLCVPDSEPGYFFWRDLDSGLVTRRTEWFVTRTPAVRVAAHDLKYLLSFAVPRFCDQALSRTRKASLYDAGTADWIAKLDTVVHELYHIDPGGRGLRTFARADGSPWPGVHGPHFFEDVAAMVRGYLNTAPDPALLEFLRYDFAGLTQLFGSVSATTFRQFPSYPKRYRQLMQPQPAPPDLGNVPVQPIAGTPITAFSDADLQLREFLPETSRPIPILVPAAA